MSAHDRRPPPRAPLSMDRARRRTSAALRRWQAGALALGLAPAVALAPAAAHAFCGFYVSGADGNLYNNATQVVLMRDGNRTVLSMANNYQGPPQDFAMVVPVPVVLHERDVKVLPPEIFERVDALAAPRLVEYWEQDPCSGGYGYGERKYMVDGMTVMNPAFGATAAELRVTVEAQFAVGEYEIVILSAEDSLGLDTWLRERGYNIPAGAAAALRPYIHKGMKFFVAKVDVKKVKRDAAGRVTLSPLRFHYDSPTFSLPVRLGLLNSSGAQELIIHILSRTVRYQVANYKNVAAPTNVDVTDATRDDFARFYAALFDRVVREDPGAVVTEYAWDASTCDPCPVEPLDVGELATLGLDVLPSYRRWFARPHEASEAEAVAAQLVLTRLHARYSAASLGEDLVFQAATPIVGGRETFADDGVTIERGARPDPSGSNNFQTRFVIRHRWTGAITCPEPRRGRWGGPPGGGAPPATQASAGELAVTERDAPLERYLVDAARSTHAPLLRKDRVPAPEPIRGCRVSDSGLAGLAGFALVGLVALGRRRTRRA